MSLGRFFEPRSIAIIGASSKRERIGGRPVAYLIREWLPRDPRRRLYPVNPGRTIVQGQKSHKSVASIGVPVDLAIIAVPSPNVIAAIRDCVAARCYSAIVCSAGFAETGDDGRALQMEIATIAAATGMRVLGPNCLGLFNLYNGVFATFAEAGFFSDHAIGNIAVASQSGATMSQLLMLARSRGIGLGKMISTGNECDVDVAECIEYFASDPQTKVILAYLEGCPNGARLVSALEAARRAQKPVIVIKVGSSAVGRIAAHSHTGALAGEDRIFNAIFEQYGAHRAESFDDALDVAYVCSLAGPARGKRVGLVTISGGTGALMADIATSAGLAVSPLPATAASELAALLPFATPANPLDTTAHPLIDLTLPPKIARAMLGAGYDALIFFLAYMGQSPRIFGPLVDALGGVRAEFPNTPFVFCSLFTEPSNKLAAAKRFLLFEDPSRAVKAVAAWASIHARYSRAPASWGRVVHPPVTVPDKALNEHETKDLLTSVAIARPREHLASSPLDAVEAACAIGFPVVMKMVSSALQRKSEIGGVVLDVRDIDAARRTYQVLVERARQPAAPIPLDGVLVSKKMTDGIEMILGSIEDPTFGTMIMLGMGGALVESFNDVAFRRPPITPGDADAMINAVRGSRLLGGVRGRPAVDRAALLLAIVEFSELVTAYGGKASLEINPLLVRYGDNGVVALDAVFTRHA
ncbi:MAG: acetate--CoA ligase family protein [Burkholderiales bacterium]